MGTFAKAFADGLRPVKITTVSEWADEYRYLSRKTANEPGKWRTSRTPYLREIMDECSLFRPSRKIVIKKSAQLGVSEAVINVTGYHIFLDPSNFLYLMPTEHLAKKIAKTKFEPMVDSSPELMKLVGRSAENPLSGKEEKNSETILSKEFINGSISFGSASSPNSLSTVSAKILIMDECDRYNMDIKSEGDPIALAANRCAAMSRYKIIMFSTPTLADESIISAEFEESDKRFFHVPCPHCLHKQVLRMENFRFEMDSGTKTASEAWFVCEECGQRIEESRKTWFLERGEWIATATGSCVGFHISGFYSPPGWRSWREIATTYNRAVSKGDHRLLKVFYNTVLGLEWSEPTSRPEWERVMSNQTDRLPGKAPRGVLVITAGVDVQADRLECKLVGYSPDGNIYIIDYQIFSGDTSSNTPWDQLEGFLRKPVTSEIENVKIPVSICCVDAGFRTTKVYAFIRRFLPGRKVVAVKGRDDLIVPVGRPSRMDGNARIQKMDRRGIELFPVGVSVIKEKIYSDIQARPDPETGELPPNFVHFPELPVEYYKQLTAEESRVVFKKGQESRTWRKVYRNNEALDVFVYCLAGYYILGIHRYSRAQWTQLSDELFPAEKMGESVTLGEAGKPLKIKPKVKKSSFWE